MSYEGRTIISQSYQSKAPNPRNSSWEQSASQIRGKTGSHLVTPRPPPSSGNQLELKVFHEPLWDLELLRGWNNRARTDHSLCYPVTRLGRQILPSSGSTPLCLPWGPACGAHVLSRMSILYLLALPSLGWVSEPQ